MFPTSNIRHCRPIDATIDVSKTKKTTR